MKRLFILLIYTAYATTALAGPYSDQLRRDPPRTGRYIAEDGTVLNIANEILKQPINIARGRYPGAQLFSAYGERTTAGQETNYPIWPDGATINTAAYGTAITIQSTSANDAVGGTGIQSIHVHYLQQDFTDTQKVIELDGITPVPLSDPKFLFMQCIHVNAVGSGGKAAGLITVSASGTIYSEIPVGELRCSSSFRMVPKGTQLYIDNAVGSSVSATADTTTIMRIVASQIETHYYRNPLIFVPHASVGMQNSAVSAEFPTSLGPFDAGTIVGCIHSTNKAAIVACTWFGHLEPVQ